MRCENAVNIVGIFKMRECDLLIICDKKLQGHLKLEQFNCFGLHSWYSVCDKHMEDVRDKI